MAESLRTETAGLTRLAAGDLDRLWQLILNGGDVEEVLRALLPALVVEYGLAGAALAADWYDDLRDRESVPGRFSAVPVEATDRGAQQLVGWAVNEATDDAALRTLIDGGVQRRVADHVRETITGSVVADPRAEGWRRTGGGGACDFCRELFGRVYSESGSRFRSHDHCGCTAVPVWNV